MTFDKETINLGKALVQAESGGNPNPVSHITETEGSKGSFQFLPATFNEYGQRYLGGKALNGRPLDINDPSHQNLVALSYIQDKKNQKNPDGSPKYTAGDIAASWNAGEGRIKNWQNNRGVNKYGNKYDTPAYVTKVGKYYEEIKNGQPTQPQTVTEPATKKKTGFLEKTGNVLNTLFGGKKIGELIGTKIAENRFDKENSQLQMTNPRAYQQIKGSTFGTPTPSQIVGDAARIGLNFTPVGKVAQGLTTGAKVAGLGKLAVPLAKVGTGAGVGYGADVATNLVDGKENVLTPGIGTGVGAAVSAIPVVGKGLSKLGQEALGASTGTGAGTIKQFGQSMIQGGEKAKVAREALRGNVNPQEIVDEARSALGTVIKNKTDAYKGELSKLKTKTNVIDHTPIIQKFNKQLEDFGVFSNADGTPNFSRAPGLGRYEKDLTALSKTLSEWGTREGDNTIAGIDGLKQVIDDFRIGTADSKKFDSFVQTLRTEAKNIIEKDLLKAKDLKTLSTYKNMLSNFEKSTKDIREIQKALSLGDKASVDTAFRKLSTVLRTNNEIRQQAISELDDITGGMLLPKIAGQQMSEVLPRGLARSLGTFGAGAGLLTGVGIVPMLKLALFSSPRTVGEVISILGFTGNKAKIITNALGGTGLGTKLALPATTNEQ